MKNRIEKVKSNYKMASRSNKSESTRDRNDKKNQPMIKLIPVRLDDFVRAISSNKVFNGKDVVKVNLRDRDLQNLVQNGLLSVNKTQKKNVKEKDQLFTIAPMIGGVRNPLRKKSKYISSTSEDQSKESELNKRKKIDGKKIKVRKEREKNYSSSSILITEGASGHSLGSVRCFYDLTLNKYIPYRHRSITKRNLIGKKNFYPHSFQKVRNRSRNRDRSRTKSARKQYHSRSSAEKQDRFIKRSSRKEDHSKKETAGKSKLVGNDGYKERRRLISRTAKDNFMYTYESQSEDEFIEERTTTYSSREDIRKYSKEIATSTDVEMKTQHTGWYCKFCKQHREYYIRQDPWTKQYKRENKHPCGCSDCTMSRSTDARKKPRVIVRLYDSLTPKYQGRKNIKLHCDHDKTICDWKNSNRDSTGKQKIICDNCIITARTKPVIDKSGKLHLVLNKQGYPMQ